MSEQVILGAESEEETNARKIAWLNSPADPITQQDAINALLIDEATKPGSNRIIKDWATQR